MMIPIRWTFRRQGTMPVIDALGTSNEAENEVLMLLHAVELFNIASEFKGKPYFVKPEWHIKKVSQISVSFSVIFQSEADIQKFMGFLDKLT